MVATLYRIKPRFQQSLEPVVAALARRGVGANAVTWLGLALSTACGALAVAGLGWRPLLFAVPIVLLARMAANAMDGQLARRAGPTSHGAVLNEVCDVAGDALAYLPFTPLVGGAAAPLVVAVVVTGLVAEMAAVVGGGPRRNDGPLGKSDRAFAFSLLAVAIATDLPRTLVVAALGTMLVMAVVTTRNRMRAV